MRKTYSDIIRELSSKKKGLQIAKRRVSILRLDLLNSRHHIKTLIGQYERIVREQQKILNEYKANIGKIVALFFFWKIKKIKQKFLW